MAEDEYCLADDGICTACGDMNEPPGFDGRCARCQDDRHPAHSWCTYPPTETEEN